MLIAISEFHMGRNGWWKLRCDCVLNFDEATGYMIGKKDKGLNAMFTMMNLERIVVGIQGLGISEIAYQNSLAYAKERKQGKTNNTKST